MSQTSQANTDPNVLVGEFPQIGHQGLSGNPVQTPVVSVPNEAVKQSPLERLEQNITQLENLHGRLGFMMAELSQLIK